MGVLALIVLNVCFYVCFYGLNVCYLCVLFVRIYVLLIHGHTWPYMAIEDGCFGFNRSKCVFLCVFLWSQCVLLVCPVCAYICVTHTWP